MPSFTQEQVEDWMRRALDLAAVAATHDDIPVGAVVVDESGQIIGEGKNEREKRHDPAAHAELVAITAAAKKRGTWNLTGCHLFVTLEPCLMCTGLIVQSRIKKIWYGADDPKGGAVTSTYGVGTSNKTNHKFEFESGIFREGCSKILKEFFAHLRQH